MVGLGRQHIEGDRILILIRIGEVKCPTRKLQLL